MSSRCEDLKVARLQYGAGANRDKAMQIALSLCHVIRTGLESVCCYYIIP